MLRGVKLLLLLALPCWTAGAAVAQGMGGSMMPTIMHQQTRPMVPKPDDSNDQSTKDQAGLDKKGDASKRQIEQNSKRQ